MFAAQSLFCIFCIFIWQMKLKNYTEVKIFHGRTKKIVCILCIQIDMIITVVREVLILYETS